MMIVKIQRPLNDAKGPLLVVDQERRFVEGHPQDEKILAKLGDDLKGYFEAQRGLGCWEIGERVAEQDW